MSWDRTKLQQSEDNMSGTNGIEIS